MITEGKYSVWFRTSVGEGAGVVELGPNGMLSGGDSSFSYSGRWKQEGDRFTAELTSKRFASGPPGVFGLDEIDITVTGVAIGDVVGSCTGFAKQAPGLRLDVTLVRMRD